MGDGVWRSTKECVFDRGKPALSSKLFVLFLFCTKYNVDSGVESSVVWLVALIPTCARERPLSRGLHCKGKARFCAVQ